MSRGLNFSSDGVGSVVERPKGRVDEKITVPSRYKFGWVHRIGDEAFVKCYEIKRVVIPDSMDSIGKMAFGDCYCLSEVEIAEYGLLSIGDSAFCGCGELSDITIPSSVSRIGDNAFEGCKKLRAVRVPNLVSWCATEFGNEYSNPLHGGGSLYLNGDSRVVTDLTIPKDVSAVRNFAFYGCGSLESVKFEKRSRCERIGREAFCNCSNLKTVRLHSLGGISIAGESFSGCASLEEITFPKDVRFESSQVFERCDSLARVYYTGGKEDWAKVTKSTIGFLFEKQVTVYFYSDAEPAEEGDFWHLDNDNKTEPVPYEKGKPADGSK